MSNSLITDDQFHHIAHLARLPIKPEENFIKDQLSQAAEYSAILNELNTDSATPTYQVNHKTNVLREDVISPSLSQSEALSQAVKTSSGYFVTTATIKK